MLRRIKTKTQKLIIIATEIKFIKFMNKIHLIYLINTINEPIL